MWSNFVTKVWMITARGSSNTLCLLHVEFHQKPPKKRSIFKLFKCFIQLFLLAFLSNLNFALLGLEASLAALVPFLIALLCTCSVFFSRSLSSFSSFFFFLAMFLAMLYKPDWVLLAFLLSLVSCFFSRPSSRISYSFSKRPSIPMCDIPPSIPLLKSLRLFFGISVPTGLHPISSPCKQTQLSDTLW